MGQNDGIQFCCEINKPGISWYFCAIFFFVDSLIFGLFFFPCVPCYSLKGENLWDVEIHFTPGKKTRGFSLAERQVTFIISFINKNDTSKSSVEANVSSHSEKAFGEAELHFCPLLYR